MNGLSELVLAVRATCASAGVPPWTLCQLVALAAGLVGFRPVQRSEWRVFASGAAGAALGAVVLGACLQLPQTLATSASFSSLLELRVSSYGALGGFAVGALLAARNGKTSPWQLLDRLAPAFGLFVAFGRLGCFVAGCDFGRPTSADLAVRYPQGTAAHLDHVHSGLVEAGAPWSLPVVPVQLYEALVGVLMLAVAVLLGPSRTAGVRFSCVAATYAAGRFLTDLLRADLPRLNVVPSLSFAQTQFISLVLLGTLAAVWAGRAFDAAAATARRAR